MQNNRKRNSIIILIAVLSFLMGNLSNGFARSDRADVLRNLEKFSRIYQKIVSSYVEDQESEELIDAAIIAMIEQLDPFSQYMDEDMLEDLMTKTKGEFGGLGIIISNRGNYPTVISPIDDTPAARLGIRGGDKIVEIEGESTEGWKVQDAVDKLRGAKGTPVNIGIRRYGDEAVVPYEIVRDIIEIKSVPYYYTLPEDIGYIRCTNFGERTAIEMREAIDELEENEIKGLIIDLRNNPGGLLESAREVSDLFLESGHLVVSTRGRDGKRLQEIYAQDNLNYAREYPLVVLINGASASASEIVAGAIQDWDRGMVMGTNSFGKGSVQSIFPVGEAEALKLTTAKYYTPSGRCIHRNEYNQRHGDDDADGEINDGLEVESEGEFPGDLPLYETLKLQREVRGGGGIMPDIILQSEEISDAALELERQSAFFKFSVEIVAEQEVTESFDPDDALLEKFRGHLVENEIELSDSAVTATEDYIRMAIRREVLYKKFGGSAAYRSTLGMDRVLQETLKLMNDSASLETLFAKSTEIEESTIER